MIKRLFLHFIAIAAFALALPACTEDTDDQALNDSDGTEQDDDDLDSDSDAGDDDDKDDDTISAADIKLADRDAELNDDGVVTEAVDYVMATEYWDDIKSDSCWDIFMTNISKSITVPSDAELIYTLDQLMSLEGGTAQENRVYHVKGDFVLPTKYDSGSYDNNPQSMGITIPSYATIYFEGSIYKEGFFLGDIDEDDGIEEENRWDVIFNLSGCKGVNMYGVNSAKVESTQKSVGFLVTDNADGIHIEGFYMDNLWEGVSCGWGTKNITVLRNTIYYSGKRSIWFLGTESTYAAYNFVYMSGCDGVDFDYSSTQGVAYRNIMVGCARWATFVEEGANNNYMADQLCVMKVPFKGGWCMGFANNGTSESAAQGGANLTHDNYFIKSMSVQPAIFGTEMTAKKLEDSSWSGGGGNFFSKAGVGGTGDTYFWGNTELGCSHPTSGDSWVNAIWEDDVPQTGLTLLVLYAAKFNSLSIVM